MDEMRKPKPYEVGVQISCRVHPEMPPEGAVQRTAAASWGKYSGSLAEQKESRD